MIKKEEKAVLKAELGVNYTKKVREVLKKSHIYNRNGLPYSDSMIRRVFNGYCDHQAMEDAILQAYLESKQDREQALKSKRKILGL